MKKLLVIASAAAALAFAGVATASGLFGLLDSMKATLPYHDLEAAKAAGYTFRLPELSGKTCIVQPGEGAMGVHMVNTSLLDAVLDPKAPEALVYQPRRLGEGLKLVALEYVVFKSAWEEAHGAGAAPPTMFGRTFDFVGEPNRYGLPAFYALHSWIWKTNPRGLFYAWNPTVACDGS